MAQINKGEQSQLKATNEFIPLIPTLKLNELLEIEFRIGNIWEKMLVCLHHTQKKYRCNVCNVIQYGERNLFGHVVGKKHVSQMVPVKQLYLLKYTLPKNDNKSSSDNKIQIQGNKEVSVKAESSPVGNNSVNTKNPNVTAEIVASPQTESNAFTQTSTPNLAIAVAEQSSKTAIENKSTIFAMPKSAILNAKGTSTSTAPTVKPPPAKAAPVKTNVVLPVNVDKQVSRNIVVKTSPRNTKFIPVKVTDKVPALKSTPVSTKVPSARVITQIPTTKAATKTTSINTNVATVKVAKPVPITTLAKTTPVTTKVTSVKNAAQISTTTPLKTALVNSKAIPTNVSTVTSSKAMQVIIKAPIPMKITTQSPTTKKAYTASINKAARMGKMALQATNEQPQLENIAVKKETLYSDDIIVIQNKSVNANDVQNLKEGSIACQNNNIDAPLPSELNEQNLIESVAWNVSNNTIDCSLEEGAKHFLDDEEILNSDEIIPQNPIIDNNNKEKSLIVCTPFAKLVAPSQPIEIIELDDDDENDNVELINNANVLLNTSTTKSTSYSNKEKSSEEFESKDQHPSAIQDSKNLASQPSYQENRIVNPSKPKSNKKCNTIIRKKGEQHNELDSECVTFDSDRYSSRDSQDIEGLVGVEYVIKVQISYSDKSPRYECCLCELFLTRRAMQNHLLGYNHRLKYCEKHFPTAIRQYRQYMTEVPEHEIFKVMTPVLDKLAVAIEEHHGREMPFKCYERDFNKNRNNYVSKVFLSRHASEQYGPSFTHVIDAKEVDELIRNRHTFRPRKSMYVPKTNVHLGESTVTQCEVSGYEQQQEHQHQYQAHHMVGNTGVQHINKKTAYVDDETHKLMVEDFLKGTNIGDGRRDRGRMNRTLKRGRSRSTSSGRKRRRSRSNSRSSHSAQKYKRKSISPLRDGDIWQAYRHMVDQKLRELESVFDQYKKDPESHPLYNDQWQKFWKRRKDELIAAGIDHRKYNYQNEWSLFFKARMEQLYCQDKEMAKIQCRERLYLPMTNDEMLDSKYHVHVINNQAESAFSDSAANVVNINEDISSENHQINSEHQAEEITTSQIPNVIHVLRILTALEEYLGSLGPKITEMLSKALILDKSNPEGIDVVFNTREHCAVLETAKEKFKGLVIAGLLDAPKERALKKAISETDTFLKYTLRKIETSENERNMQKAHQKQLVNDSLQSSIQFRSQSLAFKAPNNSMPATSISIPPQILQSQLEQPKNLTESEKNSLAAKLAASLVAQGRTNFGSNQLRQIIEIYSIIEKKKRAEENRVSTDSDSLNAGQNTIQDSLTRFSADPGDEGSSSSGRSSFSSQTVNTPNSNRNNVNLNEIHTSSHFIQSNTSSTSSLPNTLNSSWRTGSGNGGGDGNSGMSGFTVQGHSQNIVGGLHNSASSRNISGNHIANPTDRPFSITNTNINNMNTSGNRLAQNVTSSSSNFNQFNLNQTQSQGMGGLNRTSGQMFNSQMFGGSSQFVNANQSIPSLLGNSVWANNNGMNNNMTGSSGGSMHYQNRTFVSNNPNNFNNYPGNFRRKGDRHLQPWNNRFN